MSKHVFMFIPAFGNVMTTTTALTTHAIKDQLNAKGIHMSVSALSFPDIAELRSIVATIWIDTMPSVDYLLFIDSDMGFPPEMVTDMILFDEPLVGSIYPQRKMPLSWAGSGSGAGTTERRGNFMEVEGVGMGCTLIKREVMLAIMQKFPELIDTRVNLHPAVDILRSAGANRLIRAFEKLEIKERGIISEDLSFCIRWNQCGGRTWAAIGYDMAHIGFHNYTGNYLRHINEMQAQMQAQEQAAALQGQQVVVVPTDQGMPHQVPVVQVMPPNVLAPGWLQAPHAGNGQQPVEVPVKRKRGRPRKNPEIHAATG